MWLRRRDRVDERVQRERVLGRAVDAEVGRGRARRDDEVVEVERTLRAMVELERVARPVDAGDVGLAEGHVALAWKMPRTAYATSAAFRPAVATS